MNREILFRGKRMDNGEWVFGYPVCCGNIAQIGTFNVMPFGIQIGNGYAVAPSTVGQYTGKTVKTGKVFQDDIGKSIDGIFLVVWDDEKAAFMMQFYDYPQERLYLDDMWDDAEIIGNLHDNPELMGGEDDG